MPEKFDPALREKNFSLANLNRALKFMYYVYLIKNKMSKENYIGYTEDLQKRFREHKNKNPELIYYEAYKSKEDATKREYRLKQRGQGVRWLKSRLINSLK